MQAGAYIGDGKVGVIEVDEPPPPARGEVTLDSAFAGVCGSDLHMVEAQFFPPRQVIGHEFSATVRSVADDVDAFAPGDRVTLRPWVACGHCASCGDSQDSYCEEATGIGSFQGLTAHSLPGGMAPRLNVPAAGLHHLPDTIGLELGALIEPLAVAWHAVKATGLGPGDDCLILGAGPIGIALIMAARALGVSRIIVTERISARAETAGRFGADHVLLAGRDDIAAEIARLCPRGAHTVFDAVGVPGTIHESITYVRRGGRVQVVGVCMQPDPVLPALWLAREPTIAISFIYNEAEFAETVELVASRKIDAEAMITRVESMHEIGPVFGELASAKEDVKVLLKPLH
jgi:(R,R)-butanediol dehydrogenase/meso-butanediol dehydrogenase/diacetyl reductase